MEDLFLPFDKGRNLARWSLTTRSLRLTWNVDKRHSERIVTNHISWIHTYWWWLPTARIVGSEVVRSNWVGCGAPLRWIFCVLYIYYFLLVYVNLRVIAMFVCFFFRMLYKFGKFIVVYPSLNVLNVGIIYMIRILSYPFSGVDRELRWRRHDGSFSVWGNRDRHGSTWWIKILSVIHV